MSAFFLSNGRRSFAAPTLLAAIALAGASQTANAQSFTPKSLVGAHALGPVGASEEINLALTLPLRNQSEAMDLLRRQHDPHDPLYGKYLTPAEFASRFSPTAAQYEALASYYTTHGYRITSTTPNRLILNVSAPAATVQSTFQVNLGQYRQPTGRAFYSADREPQIPTVKGVTVAGVVGLDNAAQMHTNNRVTPVLSPLSQGPSYIGSGLGGGLSPSDIKKAYSLDTVSQTGAGQTLAVFELDGYKASDITAYKNQYGLPAPTLQNILIDGFSGTPSTTGYGSLEVALDIELMIALAPNASKILVYEAPNSFTSVINTYNRIATDNLAKSISTSWGLHESGTSQTIKNGEANAFLQMALQGQSMFAASGDAGAYDDGATLSVDDPASNPLVTAVGGTTLAVNGDRTYKSESSWNDPSDTSRGSNGAGGGGGVSAVWAKPDYQGSFGVSSTARNVPDVSLCADQRTGYSTCWNGNWYIVGGTSAAAPLWASFVGLVNQQRATLGLHTIGYFNPVIYQLTSSPTYNSVFHDINDGSTNLFYPATTGYDNATGLGSFNGANMLAALASAPDAPSNLTAAGGDGVVALSWTASANASGYYIYRATTSGGPYSYLDTRTVANDVDTTAQNGTTYYYVVIATNNGLVSLSSNEASATPVAILPTGLSISPSTILGGQRATGTVTIASAAPAGGLEIALSSSDTSTATVYAVATVPAGATTGTFPIAATNVTTSSTVTITASHDGVSQTATLTVNPNIQVSSVSVTPNPMASGGRATGTVTLSSAAPTGGQVVTLTSSNKTEVVVYANVTVPAGATSATFLVAAQPTATTATSTITASMPGYSQTTVVTVNPYVTPTSVTLGASTIYSGGRTTGTVTLSAAAPTGGLVVSLASGSTDVVVYSTVAVPAGATSATFPVAAKTTAAATTTSVSATLNGVTQSAPLTIVAPVTLTGISIAQNPIKGGLRTTGTVTLSDVAPAGGLTVNLASSDKTTAVVYASIAVPAGASTATFPIATLAVATTTSPTITATLNGSTQATTITVTP